MINITFKNTLFKILTFVPMHYHSPTNALASFLANCSHSLTKVFHPTQLAICSLLQDQRVTQVSVCAHLHTMSR